MSNPTERKHLDQLHYEHKLWMSSSALYEDELTIYSNLLGEIAAKNEGPDVQRSIEQFQNQFIIQKEQLDILSHRINTHERSLAKYAQQHPVAIDHVLFEDHDSLRDGQETFDRLFRELKSQFTSFLRDSL